MEKEQAARRWYFVCLNCEAKWFSPVREMECPRCENPVRSGERLTVPWLSRVSVKDGRHERSKRKDGNRYGF
jgi:Zn finger protein HypA/HybF involved in hydrogenase expression